MSALIGYPPRIRLDNRVGAVGAMCYCTHSMVHHCITLYRLFQCLDFASIPVCVLLTPLRCVVYTASNRYHHFLQQPKC